MNRDEFIYVGGCDVGIKNLTFCVVRVPLTCTPATLLQHIDIVEMKLINIHQQPSSTKETPTDTNVPSCSHLNCSQLPKYFHAGNAIFYCERHFKKVETEEKRGHCWHWISSPEGPPNPPQRWKQARRKQKRLQNLTTVPDSDEEQQTEKEKKEKKQKLSLQNVAHPELERCGLCAKDLLYTQYSLWVGNPTDIPGVKYLPCCMACARNKNSSSSASTSASAPHDHYTTYPLRYEERQKQRQEGEPAQNGKEVILRGPPMTETECDLDAFVSFLYEREDEALWRTVDVMFIENQPARVNPRMKSIQMVLYGYCQWRIRQQKRGGRAVFVSPNLKWKMNMPDVKDDASYREHKQESVRSFLQWIDQTRPDQSQWAELVRKEKKRDDLCDAFWLLVSGFSQWKISPEQVVINQNQENHDDTRDDLSRGEMG
jgi:hypothetical protein